MNDAPQRWLASPEFVTACRRCDALGVHAYAFRDFDDAGYFAAAERLLGPVFGSMPWALTEYGINDPPMADVVKGARYAALVQRLPARYVLATAYHLDTAAEAGSDAADYALDLTGDRAYAAAMA